MHTQPDCQSKRTCTIPVHRTGGIPGPENSAARRLLGWKRLETPRPEHQHKPRPEPQHKPRPEHQHKPRPEPQHEPRPEHQHEPRPEPQPSTSTNRNTNRDPSAGTSGSGAPAQPPLPRSSGNLPFWGISTQVVRPPFPHELDARAGGTQGPPGSGAAAGLSLDAPFTDI